MSAQTIRTALGLLQDDPDLEAAWNDLQDAVTAPDPGMPTEELSKLLRHARRAHATRAEWDAVTRLLELEVAVSAGTPAEIELQRELSRVLDDEAFEEEAAQKAYLRLRELAPSDEVATAAIERSESKRARWKEIADRYLEEANGSEEGSFKSSLLMGAAEVAYRFGGDGAMADVSEWLLQAVRHDPKNKRATSLLERVYRADARWTDAAFVAEIAAQEGGTKEDRQAAYLRLARLVSRHLGDKARAAAAYERLLDLAPGQREAMSFLSEHFSESEDFDSLAALYEDQLRGGGVAAEDEPGITFQIAMVHWRMRGKPDAAEPWFERVRKANPTHPGMLGFFRAQAEENGHRAKFLQVLTEAQRALPEGAERAALTAEAAKLNESDANAGKAIEQYKAALRQDPANKDAREALKRLYTQTEAYNPLVDLLRQDLDKTPAEDGPARLLVLREIADVYRQHLKSDTALMAILTQIVALDERDVDAIRDLVRVYESLARWRDLLTYQQKLANLLEAKAEKVDLLRAVARRWLDQFSNVQNAVDAYESLLEADAKDEEARAKLRELYSKRRAWPQLYALSEKELVDAVGPARLELQVEMAKLAAERLDRGADAVKLLRQAVEETDGAAPALDALEKQGEREKDYGTVAEVLERRVTQAADDASRLAVLQKLGAVYADRLNDPIGSARAWRRVLELSPGHAKALRVLRDAYLAANDLDALEELYASQNDWEGLAEVLSVAADKAPDPLQKVELSLRTARVYEERLQQAERAFRAYERILSVQPDDARAARALVPIYENEERWVRLPALYEILLGTEQDTDEKVRILRRLSQIAGGKLSDKPAAAVYARRAYDLEPGAEGALDFLELACRAAGQWEPLIGAVEARLQSDALTTKERRELKAKLAEVHASEQGNVDEAVRVYRALVEEDPTDDAAIGTLDRLLRSADRRDDLRWLFELRVGQAAAAAAKADILDEWAVLEEEAFGEAARAVALFERSLALAPTGAASLSALSRLLLAAGDKVRAAEILATRRDLADGSARADREAELAELYVDALGRPEDALAAAIRVLELSPHDARAIRILERLSSEPVTRGRAAEVLQGEYAETGDPRQEARALKVLLDDSTDPAERLVLFVRLADVQQNKLQATSAALDLLLRALAEHPTELSLWERAGELSSAAGRPTDYADALKEALRRELAEEVELDLLERAAQVHDERLGDPEGAVPFLDRILARRPTDEKAFLRLKQVLTGAERWAQLEDLYERATNAAETDDRKVELLAEIALVSEEITGENGKAIALYERILVIDSLHEQAMRALDSLYRQEKRPRELSTLLGRRLEVATSAESVELRLRLARIFLDELHEPASSLPHLEEVVRLEVANIDVRQILERVLDIGSLRSRSAELLEMIYETRDEPRDLVRVLEIRLESAADDDTRRALLQRIADLRDARLSDDTGSLSALARLVPLDPSDSAARTRLRDIGRRLGESQQVVEVLLAAAKASAVKEVQGEILMEVAQLQEDILDDRARAEETYARVVAIDPEDRALVLPASRALERIHASTGNNKALAADLQTQVLLEEDAETRRDLWARLGELHDAVLEDPTSSIAAWRARLQEDPSDDRTLASLERLYERTGAHRELVETLRVREQNATDRDARRAMLVKIAETLAGPLGDKREAIETWRTVVDEYGADRNAHAALAALYESTEQWQDLASILEADLLVAETSEARLSLYARLGDVRRQRLGDMPGTLAAYREALGLDPAHAPSRLALELLLEDADARRDVAEILHPLYEADGDNEHLLRVLEIETESAELPADKLTLLEQAVRTAEGPLNDPARAFGYAKQALAEAVGEPTLDGWLARAEDLAERTGKHGELAEVLAAVTKDVLDEDLSLAMTLRVAELAETKAGDLPRAITWYRKALDIRSDERRALVALERLYEKTDDGAALLEIVKKRVETAETDDERRELLYREAVLTGDVLGDKQRAIEVYESILDLRLDPPALTALETLYAATARFSDLVALYEREIGERPAHEADLRVKLAKVLETRLADVPRAFDELELALAADVGHKGALSALEALLEHGETKEDRARAAEILEPVYLSHGEWKHVLVTLRARLAANDDPEERRGFLKRLAQLHEEQEENFRAALDVTAQLFHEDIAEQSSVDELERLAKLAGADARLAEIYATELAAVDSDEPHTARLARRAAELFEKNGDTEKALGLYRRALAFEPEAREVFSAIDTLLVREKRAQERVELYRAALEHRFEPADRLATLHVIADLEEGSLSEPEKAIDTYRAALDVEERDGRALESLIRLYTAASRWRDLAELYQRRIDVESDADALAGHRLALAKVFRSRLDEESSAIDQLEAIVQEQPWNKSALAELESMTNGENKARVVEILLPLYERSDDWRELIRLNDERLSLAGDDTEKVRIHRETAKLYEERANDTKLAFAAMGLAFALDPSDGESRADLERLALILSAWDELAAAYEGGIAKTDDPTTKRELLEAVARLHDERRDDPRKSLDAYGRLSALDPSDIAPLDAMDGLALMLSDWVTLVLVLETKVELLTSDEDRASLYRRIGEAKRDLLDDSQGSIEAYSRAAELDPESVYTVDRLIELYETKGDAKELVDLLRRRVDLTPADETDTRYDLLLQIAALHETKLGNPREAIDALRESLDVRPADPDALKGLDRLLRAEQLWPELLENLRLQASGAAAAEERIALRRAIGELFRDKLDDAQEALEAFRTVLDESSTDEASIAAVRSLGESRDDLHLVAADILEPVLRQNARFKELAEILELRLRGQTDPLDRARTLRTIAIVQEMNLDDGNAALDALLRTIAETPDDTGAHEEAERLAEAAKGEGKLADVLASRAAASLDPTVAKDLFVRLGRIAETKLADLPRAITAYTAALEQAGDEPELLEALDRLYGQTKNDKSLAEVLERRISIAESNDDRASFQFRLATLQIDSFGSPAQGIATLRDTLENKPDHEGAREALEKLLADRSRFDEVAEILEGVYRSQNQHDRLVDLLKRRVANVDAPRERVRLRLDLARVVEEQINDPRRAQTILEEALADDPADPDVLAEIERIAPITAGFESAAESLSNAIAAADGLAAETACDLYVRLADWYQNRLGDRRKAESAFERAFAKSPESIEILRSLELLRREPGRERELVDTLRTRAKLEIEPDAKRELLREAKVLAESSVNDAALAESVLRQLLEDNDADEWALAELTILREKAGDFAETTKLLLRSAEVAASGDEIAKLKHRAAAVRREKLNDAAGATELYEELFDNEPTDTRASDALRPLYTEAKKHRELARLLERLVDVADAQADRTRLRIELATLQANELDAASDAIDALRNVLEDEPGHADAVVALSQLYEKTGKDDELAELLSTQIAVAEGRGDTTAELAFRVRLGEIYETRLGNAAKALETYDSVLARDSRHVGALRALARIHQAKGDATASASAMQRLLDVEEGAELEATIVKLADVYVGLKDDEAALAALERGVRTNAPIRDRLRKLYEKTGAFAKLAQIIEGDADTDETPAGKIRLLRQAADLHSAKLGDAATAASLLEKASELSPDDRELLLSLCDAYTASGRSDDSIRALERIVASYGGKRSKDLSAIQYRLGKAFLSKGDKDRALTELDAAFKIDPGSVPVLRDLGMLTFEMGDYERAGKTFRSLLLQRDTSGSITKAEVFYYLGEISHKQNDKPKAIQMLERSIEADGTFQKARDLLAELKALSSARFTREARVVR